MFQPEIVMMAEDREKTPSIVAEYIDRALRAKYRESMITKEKSNNITGRSSFHHGNNTKRNDNNRFGSGNQRRFSQNKNNKRKWGPKNHNHQNQIKRQMGNQKNFQTYPVCYKCNKQHLGEYKIGTT